MRSKIHARVVALSVYARGNRLHFNLIVLINLRRMSNLAARFQLMTSAGKRHQGSASASERSLKLPRASDISIEQGPRPTIPSSRRLPASAPVDVCVVKYTDCASDLWDLFKGDDKIPVYAK